jgi:hypothetical protein
VVRAKRAAPLVFLRRFHPKLNSSAVIITHNF